MRKFRIGDIVQISIDPKKTWKSHFTTGQRAILLYNYRQKYGGGKSEEKQWCVFHEAGYKSSWYDNGDFILLEPANDKQELSVRGFEEEDNKKQLRKLFR